MEFGSLHNHLFARASQPEPFIGQPATVLGWSDRYAATVTEIDASGTVTVRRCKSRVVSGSVLDGTAEYEHEPDPDGYATRFRRDRHGRWRYVSSATGRIMKDGQGLLLGVREEYRDPHF